MYTYNNVFRDLLSNLLAKFNLQKQGMQSDCGFKDYKFCKNTDIDALNCHLFNEVHVLSHNKIVLSLWTYIPYMIAHCMRQRWEFPVLSPVMYNIVYSPIIVTPWHKL